MSKPFWNEFYANTKSLVEKSIYKEYELKLDLPD